jgi:hypothetical protein
MALCFGIAFAFLFVIPEGDLRLPYRCYGLKP